MMNLSEKYKEYVLTEGKRPASVFAFAKKNKIQEADFYRDYSSFDALEQQFVTELLKDCITKFENDASFAEFNSREKLLSLFFALFESFRQHRSFLQWLQDQHPKSVQTPTYWKQFRNDLSAYSKELMRDAILSGEIVDRKKISDHYSDIIWLMFGFVFHFWLRDTSRDFEKTDEAIEKSVTLFFELAGKSPLESMLEFGKFIYQNSRN